MTPEFQFCLQKGQEIFKFQRLWEKELLMIAILFCVQLTVLNAGRRYLKAEDLSGKVFVTSGLGGMSGAQAKAAVIAGCVGIIAEVRAMLLSFCLLSFMCWIRTLILLIWHVPQVTLTSKTQKKILFSKICLSFSLLSIFHCYSTLLFVHSVDQTVKIWTVTSYDCFTNNAEWCCQINHSQCLSYPHFMCERV